MLDAAGRIERPGADVLAYADVDDPTVIWALPASPRLAVAADGGPDASLLLYRRGTSGPPQGGQLTIGVDLALTAAEQEATLAAAPAGRRVLSPHWTDTTTDLRPEPQELPDLVLRGRGSLIGANYCALTLSFAADIAPALEQAWTAGLPHGLASMDVTFSAATAAGANLGVYDVGRSPGTTWQGSLLAAATSRTAQPLTLHLEGPLRLGDAAASRRTVISL